MKRRDLLKSAPFAAAAATLSCSGGNENPVADTGAVDTLETKSGIAVAKTADIIPDFTPDYDNYDLVIVDEDGWVIEMKYSMRRMGVRQYEGRLRYKFWHGTYTGEDAACMYDPVDQTFNVLCKDERNRDSKLLLYHFNYGDGADMYGCYMYYPTNQQTCAITGQVFKCDIPDHIVEPPTSKIAVPQVREGDGPAVHPKLGTEWGID